MKITAFRGLQSLDQVRVAVVLNGELGEFGSVPASSIQLGTQPADATLTALAALDSSTGIVYQTGADTFEKRDIVGNVSESGGVPTGALIEKGSNSNGEYTRLADGTQICWVRMSVTDQAIDTAYGSLYQGSRTWTFPATFIAAPAVTCSEFRWGTSASWGALSSAPTTTSATLRGLDTASRATGTAVAISAIAIGRWF